jgi:hypothetical protein
MKQTHANYLNMVSTTLQLLHSNNAIWDTHTVLSNTIAHLHQTKDAIALMLQGSEQISTGATNDKEQAAEAAIKLAVKLARFTQAFAKEHNNNTLLDQMKVSYSQLDELPDEQLAPRLQDLLSHITLYATNLVDYGVDADSLPRLQAAIASFNAVKSAPRNIIVARKGHNQTIPELLRSMRHDCYMLDRLIEIWADSHPQFVRDYHNARIIVDLRQGQHKDGTQTPPVA